MRRTRRGRRHTPRSAIGGRVWLVAQPVRRGHRGSTPLSSYREYHRRGRASARCLGVRPGPLSSPPARRPSGVEKAAILQVAVHVLPLPDIAVRLTFDPSPVPVSVHERTLLDSTVGPSHHPVPVLLSVHIGTLGTKEPESRQTQCPLGFPSTRWPVPDCSSPPLAQMRFPAPWASLCMHSPVQVTVSSSLGKGLKAKHPDRPVTSVQHGHLRTS